MKKHHFISILIAMMLICQNHLVWADLKTDVGYARLSNELGYTLPTGAGVPVVQVEAESSPGLWMPDAANAQFNGKTISDNTGGGGVSAHATTVATCFYGTTGSMAPGVTTIDAYAASTDVSDGDWLTMGYLMAWVSVGGYPVQPMYSYNPIPFFRIMAAPGRICNHSWVSDSSSNGDMLRRLDFVIETDEFIQMAAVNNGTTPKPLMSGAFNAVTIGRTDGNHPTGTLAVDTIYMAGRTCPLIVVPVPLTSEGAPVAASAAALLIQAGRETDSGNDPQQTSISDRSGRVILNSERAETIKAALMAGADRFTYNGDDTAQITDYRGDPAHRSNNGLDDRFGAGQLNVYHSYHIIAGGEQNSSEDDPGENGRIDAYGFDVDPYFGGLSGSNTSGTYKFTADSRRLYASLVWHLDIDGGTQSNFDATATTYNLELALFDTTNGDDRLVDASMSTKDNTENIWVATVPGRNYRLEVYRAASQSDFLFDYALAWRMATPPDTDGDGIDNEWEVQFGLDPANAADGNLDADADGLTAHQEYLLGTDINNSDTDGDLATDGDEAATGSDPLDPDDLPGSNAPLAMPALLAALLALMGIGRYYAKKAKLRK